MFDARCEPLSLSSKDSAPNSTDMRIELGHHHVVGEMFKPFRLGFTIEPCRQMAPRELNSVFLLNEAMSAHTEQTKFFLLGNEMATAAESLRR